MFSLVTVVSPSFAAADNSDAGDLAVVADQGASPVLADAAVADDALVGEVEAAEGEITLWASHDLGWPYIDPYSSYYPSPYPVPYSYYPYPYYPYTNPYYASYSYSPFSYSPFSYSPFSYSPFSYWPYPFSPYSYWSYFANPYLPY
jgi:hypothetical protein